MPGRDACPDSTRAEGFLGALEKDLFFGGTWAANGTGGVRLRACLLRRLVRERQTAPVLELDSRTTGMTFAGGGRAFRDP